MRFFMPVMLYDEEECVKKHAAEIAAFGKKALIVTGKNSAFRNGSFEDVSGVLKDAGIGYEVFSEVEENPSTDTVFKAKERFAEAGIDFIIGIGGGSPMDAAKAIALVLKHPEADIGYLYDKTKDPSALPVICIPTSCGTGSEVTGISVLTRHDKKTKISMVHHVFPAMSLVDGKYIRSASKSLIVNSAVDALAHMFESALNAKTDDYVHMTVSAGLKQWIRIKDVLSGEREASEEDRRLLMRASTLAGMSIAGCGTALPHALSYILTYDLGLPHGRAVGYFLPAFMAAAPQERSGELLKAAGFADTVALKAFLEKVLGRQEVPENVLEKTFEAVKNNTAKMNGVVFPVDESVLRGIVYG
ncbi:MAG: iron-containing alcohol dehydrogenase [Lachnospiraceae bacterium]|nr:iron-containing alcohol dehydrogenase [Lachnospiraceae bacterium]